MFPIRSILFYQYPKFYSKLIISSWKTIEISNITSKRYLSNDSNEMAFDDMDDTYDETAYNWFRDSGEYQPDKHVPIDRRLAKNKPMHIEPSLKTTVILSRLPPSVTQESLSLAIGNDINHRKVELQPGCTFHIHNEPIAEKIASILENDFQCKTRIEHTRLPSLHIDNLPCDMTASTISKAFDKFNHLRVHVTGGASFQVLARCYDDAIKIYEELDAILVHDEKLSMRIVKVKDDSYIVEISNIHSKADLISVHESIIKLLKEKDLGNNPCILHKARPKTLQFRLSSKEDAETIKSTLSKIEIDGCKLNISEPEEVLRPALFVNNIKHLQEKEIKRLLDNVGATRVQFNKRSKDVLKDLVVGYFDCEKTAFEALSKLKNATVEGVKIGVSFRLVEEPVLIINDLTPRWTEQTIRDRLKDTSVLNYFFNEVMVNKKLVRNVRILFSDPKDVTLVAAIFRNNGLEPIENGKTQIGLNVDVPMTGSSGKSEEEVISRIHEVIASTGIQPLSNILRSNRSAFISFRTLSIADDARQNYLGGSIKLPSLSEGILPIQLSVQPSFVLEVSSMDVKQSINDITQNITPRLLQDIILSDRSAVIKFKRHMHVITGIKALKKLDIDGSTLQVKRYRPVIKQGNTSYDKADIYEAFDQITLGHLLSDHMKSDPGMRYQVAQNTFEQALGNSKGCKTAMDAANYILTDKLSLDLRKEAAQLLGAKELLPEAKQRLFELYIQRDDIHDLVSDFNEILVFSGQKDESDPYHFKNFNAHTDEEFSRLEEAIRIRERELMSDKANMKTLNSKKKNSEYYAEADEKLKLKNNSKIDEAASQNYVEVNNSEDDMTIGFDPKLEPSDEDYKAWGEFTDESEYKYPSQKRVSKSLSDQEIENENDTRFDMDPDETKFKADTEERIERKNEYELDEDGNLVKIVLDPTQLIDRDGRVWSGIILDEDTTQKILPGNRIMSYRALVMIGNMRGAGGFGVGKAATADKAVEAAFRDALNNLIFLDLYENASLAHDLYGKHNSCKVYIHATPKSRIMIAGSLAEGILLRFGIASASVKVAGRRNPYSVTRAIFNALKEHQNLDLIAKSRGKRYLTLRWAYQNKI